MPDDDRRQTDSTVTSDTYRAYASSLEAQADEARYPESRNNLKSVARWYTRLALYLERRRSSATH